MQVTPNAKAGVFFTPLAVVQSFFPAGREWHPGAGEARGFFYATIVLVNQLIWCFLLLLSVLAGLSG